MNNVWYKVSFQMYDLAPIHKVVATKVNDKTIWFHDIRDESCTSSQRLDSNVAFFSQSLDEVKQKANNHLKNRRVELERSLRNLKKSEIRVKNYDGMGRTY